MTTWNALLTCMLNAIKEDKPTMRRLVQEAIRKANRGETLTEAEKAVLKVVSYIGSDGYRYHPTKREIELVLLLLTLTRAAPGELLDVWK